MLRNDACGLVRGSPSQNLQPLEPGSVLLQTANSADDLVRLESIETSISHGHYQETVPLLEAYLRDYPNSARGYYDLGYAAFRTHDVRASIANLSKSLALNMDNAEAHKILGLDCSSVGRYDLAEIELRQAARRKPGSAEIHYFLGRLYSTREVYPLARKELEEATRLDPSYMKAFNNLGLIMEILGDNGIALRNYSMAMKLNEEQQLHSAWPYVNVSAYYNRQEKPELALEYAKKAVGFDPKLDVAYFQMAKAYRSQGEWKKCAEAAQKAVTINSETPDFYYVLGVALRKLGDIKGSQAALAKVEKIHQGESDDAAHQLARQIGREMGTAPGPLDQ